MTGGAFWWTPVVFVDIHVMRWTIVLLAVEYTCVWSCISCIHFVLIQMLAGSVCHSLCHQSICPRTPPGTAVQSTTAGYYSKKRYISSGFNRLWLKLEWSLWPRRYRISFLSSIWVLPEIYFVWGQTLLFSGWIQYSEDMSQANLYCMRTTNQRQVH